MYNLLVIPLIIFLTACGGSPGVPSIGGNIAQSGPAAILSSIAVEDNQLVF